MVIGKEVVDHRLEIKRRTQKNQFIIRNKQVLKIVMYIVNARSKAMPESKLVSSHECSVFGFHFSIEFFAHFSTRITFISITYCMNSIKFTEMKYIGIVVNTYMMATSLNIYYMIVCIYFFFTLLCD